MTSPIGIFGGTFDPVHFGHLRAASEIKELLNLADFRLLPAGQPPHRNTTFASGEHRLAMLRLAVADHPDVAVDDREVRRQGASYMVDTLDQLRRQYPRRPLLLLVGQDAVNGLDRWHRWRDLLQLAHLVVMTRPSAEPAYGEELATVLEPAYCAEREALFRRPAGHVHYLEVTKLAISSTKIRALIQAGRDIRFLLPERVISYIRYHRLYQPQHTDHPPA